MAESSAFINGYGGYALELPSGEVIQCEALTLSTAAKFMRLLEVADGSAAAREYVESAKRRGVEPDDEELSRALTRAAGEMSRAQIEIMETFPEAVGAKEAFEEAHITPAEFFDAVRTFMALRRPSRTGTTRATETKKTDETKTEKHSDSMT